MNFVGVAAQHPSFGPSARIPEADGLISRRRDQTSSVPGKHQFANPTRVSVEAGEEPAGRSIPDADSGIFVSRARSQESAVGREGHSGAPGVLLWFGVPKFVARGEVDAPVVEEVQRVTTCQIQTPAVGGDLGASEERAAIGGCWIATLNLARGDIHHANLVAE